MVKQYGVLSQAFGSGISCHINICHPYIYTIALSLPVGVFAGILWNYLIGSLAGGSSPVKGWIVGFRFLAAMIGLDTIIPMPITSEVEI